MSDSNDFMMIGLHKLAAARGDGLVPELLALYRQRALSAERAAADAIQAPAAGEISATSAGNDNVIPLRPYLRARQRR